MAKQSLINVEIGANNQLITFTVADYEPFQIHVAELSDDVKQRALVHGLVQKISDAAALGKDATGLDKRSAMVAVVDRLVAGDWNKRSGEGSGPVAGLIFRAVAEYARSAINPNLTDDQIRGWYDAKDRKEQLALRSIPEVREIMDRMRAEKGGAAKVDVDALLSGLTADLPAETKPRKTKSA